MASPILHFLQQNWLVRTYSHLRQRKDLPLGGFCFKPFEPSARSSPQICLTQRCTIQLDPTSRLLPTVTSNLLQVPELTSSDLYQSLCSVYPSISISGWWYTYPSEKYESQWERLIIPHIYIYIYHIYISIAIYEMESKSHVPNHQPDIHLHLTVDQATPHAAAPFLPPPDAPRAAWADSWGSSRRRTRPRSKWGRPRHLSVSRAGIGWRYHHKTWGKIWQNDAKTL